MEDGNDNLNGNAVEPVDTSALRQNVAAKAKELAGAALALEQASLFNEYPFEEGLLLPVEEMRKRYTGKNGESMEWRRNTAIYMLNRDCPVQDICELLHMNRRVVWALASKNPRLCAKFSKEFAEQLVASAAGDLALADTKKTEASYKDLHIGAGIKLTHATAISLMSGSADMDSAIEVEQVNEKLEQFREKLKQLKPANSQPQMNTDETRMEEVKA